MRVCVLGVGETADRGATAAVTSRARRVVHLDALPLLGTGKTDYRALKALLGDLD